MRNDNPWSPAFRLHKHVGTCMSGYVVVRIRQLSFPRVGVALSMAFANQIEIHLTGRLWIAGTVMIGPSRDDDRLTTIIKSYLM